MAQAGGYWLLCVPRGAHELPGTQCIPALRHRPLAACASAPQSKGPNDVGPDQEDRRRLAPTTSNPSSLARAALCRPSPKVGARCVNCARRDLCGGYRVTGIPTAIIDNGMGLGELMAQALVLPQQSLRAPRFGNRRIGFATTLLRIQSATSGRHAFLAPGSQLRRIDTLAPQQRTNLPWRRATARPGQDP